VRCVIFTHSLVSDWNHGNAHFIRGIAADMIARDWRVRIYEPKAGWSRTNLVENYGHGPVADFETAFPQLRSVEYDLTSLNLDHALCDADLVLVHEWSDPELVNRIGAHRSKKNRPYQLFLHDTHHRAITSPESIAAFDLTGYDGVLAYGRALGDVYRSRFACNAWTWHEAADARTFYPRPQNEKHGDVVWIGNWGDEERALELREFFIRPVVRLGLKAAVYGVRYPDSALAELADVGIEYRGWLPNYRVPEVFSRYRLTMHIPRRPYATLLHGIPTIRPFEALACGIPLVSAPWKDSEALFQAGRDYLMARDGDEMTDLVRILLLYPSLAAKLAQNGLATIRSRHTCAHRVEELMSISRSVRQPGAFSNGSVNTLSSLPNAELAAAREGAG